MWQFVVKMRPGRHDIVLMQLAILSDCPPGADWTMGSYFGSFDARYSVLDYARDMTDEAALQFPNNPDEPSGDDIAIYSIGLGDIGYVSTKFLRYMALIGIEGRRDTIDPCVGKSDDTWCGQYYYASGGSDLTPIFEDIASRIFTRDQPIGWGGMRKINFSSKLSSQTSPRAQSMVEFALTLPVLLLLIFGIIEFGRVLQAWLALENGARFAIRYESRVTTIRRIVTRLSLRFW